MIIGWARGGRLEALGRASLRGVSALAVAMALMLVALEVPLPRPVARVLQVAGSLLALAVLWENRRNPWALPIFIGLGLNTVVISLNGGRMPIALDALARLSPGLGPGGAVTGADVRHVIAAPATPLAALGDTIALRVGRVGVIASPGDLLMAIGLGGFVQGQMSMARAVRPPGRARPNV